MLVDLDEGENVLGTATIYDRAGLLVYDTTTEDRFNATVELANEYSYDVLQTQVVGESSEPQLLRFDKIAHPERITQLILSARHTGVVDFASQREALARFTNLDWLSVHDIKGAEELQAFFTNLRHLFFTHRPTQFTALEASWPKLRRLQIQSFRGDLASLGSHRQLRQLILVGLNTDRLDPILGFPNLEGLEIHSLRTSLDVSPLAKLPKLKQLNILSSKLQQGWDDLVLGPKVEAVSVNRLPSMAFIDNNPHIGSVATKELGELRTKHLRKMGWEDRGPLGMEFRRDPDMIGDFRLK